MGLTPWARVLVDLLVGVGMLVVLPLGLGLIDPPWPPQRRARWYLGAVPGAISLWLPRGWPAACLAGAYLLTTLWLLADLPARLPRRRFPTAGQLAVATALIAPTVASSSLVAERAGYRLFGFRLDILTLTVAHFHYAGFAAALVAGLVYRCLGDRPSARAAALAVPVGTAVVFVGYFTNDWVELCGASVLTAGMWLTGALTWRQIRPAVADRTTRVLLATSAVALVLTMLLALDWAVGEAAGVAHLPLSWMAATHGVGNALGFALCGIIAWRRMRLRTGITPRFEHTSEQP